MSDQPYSSRAARQFVLWLSILVTSALAQTPPGNATDVFQIHALDRTSFRQSGDVVHALAWRWGSVRYSRSPDGGRTWSIVDQAIATGGLPELALHGDVVVLAGARDPFATTGGPIVQVSTDGGLAWLPELQIDSWSAPGLLIDPPTVRVHVFGQNVVVVWANSVTGSIWARHSTDGGSTWPTGKLLVDQGIGTGYAKTMNLRGEGATLYVFWTEVIAGTVYERVQVSHNSGQTWLATAHATPPIASLAHADTVVASEAGMLLVSLGGLGVSRSVDHGATWTPLSGPWPASIRSIAIDGANALVAGVTPNPWPSTTEVWQFRTSTDGGSTWSSPNSVATPGGFESDAHIEGDAFYVQLANWQLPHFGALLHSGDAGQNWKILVSDVGASSISDRRTVCVRFAQHATYGRTCQAFVANGWTPIGVGTPGSGGATPSFAVSGPLLAGQVMHFDVVGALANTVGLLGVTWQPPSATAFAGGALWLSTPLLAMAFATDNRGKGTVPLAIPNSPAVAGLSWTCQAIMFDPVAQDSLALTRALEVWLR